MVDKQQPHKTCIILCSGLTWADFLRINTKVTQSNWRLDNNVMMSYYDLALWRSLFNQEDHLISPIFNSKKTNDLSPLCRIVRRKVLYVCRSMFILTGFRETYSTFYLKTQNFKPNFQPERRRQINAIGSRNILETERKRISII